MPGELTPSACSLAPLSAHISLVKSKKIIRKHSAWAVGTSPDRITFKYSLMALNSGSFTILKISLYCSYEVHTEKKPWRSAISPVKISTQWITEVLLSCEKTSVLRLKMHVVK